MRSAFVSRNLRNAAAAASVQYGSRDSVVTLRGTMEQGTARLSRTRLHEPGVQG